MASIVVAGDTSGTVTLAAPAVSGTTTLTLPTTTGNVVADTATQTLTNKTLTSPTITGATITVASTAAPAFSAYGTANQTFSSGVWTKIQCNTEEFDTNSNYDNATNYRFTPTVAGYYQLTGSFYFNTGSSGGESILSIYKNGSDFKRGTDIGNNTAGSIYQLTVAGLVYLNGSTDYVELYGYMSTGHTSGNGLMHNYFQGFLARSV